MSRLVFVTVVPDTVMTDTRLSLLRVTKRHPSVGRELHLTRAGFGRSQVDLARVRDRLTAIVSTDTVPSRRLATRASVPAALMATPDAPRPALIVASTTGVAAASSMTVTRSSGAVFVESAGSTCVADATSASVPFGVIATSAAAPPPNWARATRR